MRGVFPLKHFRKRERSRGFLVLKILNSSKKVLEYVWKSSGKALEKLLKSSGKAHKRIRIGG